MYQLLTVILVIILLFTSWYFLAKKREKFSTDQNCSPIYPPPLDPSIPTLAYGQINPAQLSSDDNKTIKPTMSGVKPGIDNYNFYDANSICKTPWSQRCWSNDTCAQFGIGETCQGPEGEQYCVCETKFKPGETRDQIANPGNITINIDGVCTNNNQCCTQYCAPVPGLFSKSCQCPPKSSWDWEQQKCLPDSSYDDNTVTVWGRDRPNGSCETTGKLCGSDKDCSLGEACTPDSFCACMLVTAGATGHDVINTIRGGGRCDKSDQCVNNLVCKPHPVWLEKNGKLTPAEPVNTCVCPEPLVYDDQTHMCTCPSLDMVYDKIQNKCVPPGKVKRIICPSEPEFIPSSSNDCGLGEVFDADSRKCICMANLHTGLIEAGKCITKEQCASGVCDNGLCRIPKQTSVMSLATSLFPF